MEEGSIGHKSVHVSTRDKIELKSITLKNLGSRFVTMGIGDDSAKNVKLMLTALWKQSGRICQMTKIRLDILFLRRGYAKP